MLLASVVAPGTALAGRAGGTDRWRSRHRPSSGRRPARTRSSPASPSACRATISRRAARRVDVTFALHRAKAKTRKGVFVTVTGGPGTSGIAAADSYTEALDPADRPRLRHRLLRPARDRPVAAVPVPRCVARLLHVAAHADARERERASPTPMTRGPTPRTASPRAASIRGCCRSSRRARRSRTSRRSGSGSRPTSSTSTARATARNTRRPTPPPTRPTCNSLLLDGPVDLTLTGFEYYDEGADALDDVLAMTLDRCTHDADCRRDVVGRDGLAGYDELAATLRGGPLPYCVRRRDRARSKRARSGWAISRPRPPATSTASSTGCCSSARSRGPRAAGCSRSRGWPTSRSARTPRRSRRSRTTRGRTPCSTASSAWTTTTARGRPSSGRGRTSRPAPPRTSPTSGSGASSTATCRAPTGRSTRRPRPDPTT